MMTKFLKTKTLALFIGSFCLISNALVAQSASTAVKPQTQPTGAQAQPAQLADDDIKKISETFGHFIGKNLKAPGIDLDLELIIKGIRNGAEGKPAPLTDQEFEKKMGMLQAQAFTKVAEQNLKEANAFLEKNKSAPGIVTLEGGKLQYQIVKPGTGNVVQPDSTPLINYKGSYLNGTVFGSSADTGGPIAVPLEQTVPGFSKGIVGMKEGETRTLYVHPDIGYGTNGALQPNSLLTFEVEIVEANHKKTAEEEEDEDEDDEDEDDEEESKTDVKGKA